MTSFGVQDPETYGEPVILRSSTIYFTSWKYVRQGGFRYERHGDAPAGGIDPVTKALYDGDGSQPATYQPIDLPTGVRLVAQKACKVRLDPGQLGAGATVLYDKGRYRAWYGVFPCPDSEPFSTKGQLLYNYNLHVAYAESDDGFHWEKPRLGFYEYAGGKDNNLVMRNDVSGSTRGWHGGSVFVDPTSTDERYKMVFLGNITEEEWNSFAERYPGEINPTARRRPLGEFRVVCALFGAVSEDGIHWRNLNDPLLIDHCDTQNTAYYDPDRGLYVVHVRTWQVNRKAAADEKTFPDSWTNIGRRSIGRAVSKDFRHFSRPEVIIAPGADMAPSHLWYTNCKTTLPGCGDNHVMFPWRWELENDGGDCFLFSSADGWSWSQVPSGPVVERGSPGESDGEYVVCSPHLVQLPGDRWGLPYHGWPIPHKYPGRNVEKRKGLFPGVQDCSGYAVWPSGRLVALECPGEGFFATVGVRPRGNRLRLNASIRPTGYIKVSAGELGGEAIPGRDFGDCDLLVGDDLAMPVTWNGAPDLSHKGRPILLRFRMRNAKLFGVEFCS